MRLRHRHGAHGGADIGVDFRHWRNTVEQGPYIKAGAANQHRQFAGRMGGVDLRPGLGGPARGGAGFDPVDMAEQAMGHATHFLLRRAGGQDRQVGIDLAGIGIDDDAVGDLGQADGERALAAGGRPGNKRDRWAGFARHMCGSVHVRRDLSGS